VQGSSYKLTLKLVLRKSKTGKEKK